VSMRTGRFVARQKSTSPAELLGWLSLDNTATSIPLARRFVRIALTARGFDDHATTLELIVSELVTNAVVHTRPGIDQPIWVRLSARPASLRLEVHDTDLRLPTARPLESESESGRGLHIVRALTDHSGSYLSPRDTGKIVWCELANAEHAKAPAA
jgi:anti-sigma regulatory factor (Ser/Thr protein kinase)